MFWDGVHPTSTAHKIISDKFYSYCQQQQFKFDLSPNLTHEQGKINELVSKDMIASFTKHYIAVFNQQKHSFFGIFSTVSDE